MSVPMREWNKNALTNMKGDLMDNVKPKESGMLPKLAKAAELGFLNAPEMQTIEAMTSERDRMDKIISILSGKADECFSKFCDILTKSNNEAWAKSLRAKAEEFKGGSGLGQVGMQGAVQVGMQGRVQGGMQGMGQGGGLPQSNGASDAILSKIVCDHPRYLILFRTYVSRRAAGGGRAVLEGLGIDTREINTLIGDNPNDMESAVQAGLIKWSGGNTPTWKILCEAMDFAEVPVQDIKGLKDALKNPPSDQTEGTEIAITVQRDANLLRKHVSRKAAKKGRAVLEGVGLDAATIENCFTGTNEEEAVQKGLDIWCSSGRKGFQPHTWEVLFEAMKYAQIEQQAIKDLKKAINP